MVNKCLIIFNPQPLFFQWAAANSKPPDISQCLATRSLGHLLNSSIRLPTWSVTRHPAHRRKIRSHRLRTKSRFQVLVKAFTNCPCRDGRLQHRTPIYLEKRAHGTRFPRIVSRNRSSAQGSTGAGNGSPKRPLTPSTINDHETQVYISPPSSPTANPSTSQSCEPKSKTKSRLPSYRRERKPSEPAYKIQAIEGESVASRRNIGTASIDSEFYKIEYGQFKERPASLIIVDVRLVYPPDNTIDRAKFEFQCATDSEHNICSVDHGSAANTKAPNSKVFAPKLIEGQPTCSKRSKA